MNVLYRIDTADAIRLLLGSGRKNTSDDDEFYMVTSSTRQFNKKRDRWYAVLAEEDERRFLGYGAISCKGLKINGDVRQPCSVEMGTDFSR